jgi:hypothetical protein
MSMDLSFPEEAVSFGHSAAKAFQRLGGVELFRRAEQEPDLRKGELLEVVESLGVFELVSEISGSGAREPYGQPNGHLALEVLCSACALVKAAGAVALPFPVASLVCGSLVEPFAQGSLLSRIQPACLLERSKPLVDHGDLFRSWTALDLSGMAFEASTGSANSARASRLGPFVVPVGLGPSVGVQRRRLELICLLDAWMVLGALESEVALTVEHVSSREQFGKPLASFQAVQFQLADAFVALAGFEELCKYTAWRLAAGTRAGYEGDGTVSRGSLHGDALALSVACQETALLVTRVCHQLHGAVGFCDEHDLSVLTRYLQPALRLSGGSEALSQALSCSIEEDGFEGIFLLPASGDANGSSLPREDIQ